MDFEAQQNNFNPETAAEARFEKSVTFEVCGVDIKITQRMPAYVFKKLRSADWDRWLHDVTNRAEQYVRTAAENGTLVMAGGKDIVRKAVQQFACQRLYDLFMDVQYAAGNEAWEVPQTLQEHTL